MRRSEWCKRGHWGIGRNTSLNHSLRHTLARTLANTLALALVLSALWLPVLAPDNATAQAGNATVSSGEIVSAALDLKAGDRGAASAKLQEIIELEGAPPELRQRAAQLARVRQS